MCSSDPICLTTVFFISSSGTKKSAIFLGICTIFSTNFWKSLLLASCSAAFWSAGTLFHILKNLNIISMTDDDGRLRNNLPKLDPISTKPAKKIVVHIPSLVMLSESGSSLSTECEKIPSLFYPKSNQSFRAHYLPPLRMRQESTPNIETSSFFSASRNIQAFYKDFDGSFNRSFRSNLTSQVFDQFKESKCKKSWLETTTGSIGKKGLSLSPRKIEQSSHRLVKLVTPKSMPKIDRFNFARDSTASTYNPFNTSD